MWKAWRFVLVFFGGLACLLAIAWAVGALYFDLPIAWLRAPLALVYGLAMFAALFLVKGRWRALGVVTAGFVVVLAWWLTLKPSNEGNWQADVAQLAWAEINGDEVTLHNVRNCDYRTETDYTARWETRTVRISQITGIDLAINYWGSPWMAHPIASFQFADAPPICFSIETRKQLGQTYSAIGGLYRQFALIYIVADERDVIRVRTNYRHGEDIYLYRTTMTPSQARERFHEYLRSLNEIRDHPRWYNAITTNCTTSIRHGGPKADEMLYETWHDRSVALPFADIKRRAHINDRAKVAAVAAGSPQSSAQGSGLKSDATVFTRHRDGMLGETFITSELRRVWPNEADSPALDQGPRAQHPAHLLKLEPMSGRFTYSNLRRPLAFPW